jgi:hypothetical protein
MLRERGLVTFQAGRASIHDLAVANRAEADRGQRRAGGRAAC